MNDHAKYGEWLPLYVSGALAPAERHAIEEHLANCPTCQSDLRLWRAVARQVVAIDEDLAAPPALVDRVLTRMPSQRMAAGVVRQAFELMRAQLPLVRGELWLASAATMAIGVIVATIVRDVAILRMLAPMVAAASIAVIYGPESDPALELTLSTSTSPWKVLLARLTLVFGYNLVLALAASLGMLLLLPADMIASLILDWLGPMTFLSAAALVLALWMGAGNAILVTYMAWLVRFLPGTEIAKSFRPGDIAVFLSLLDDYRQFWTNSAVLVAFAVLLVAAAGWLASRQERHLPRWA